MATIYFKVSDSFYEVGTPSYLYSFFSTVAKNLESSDWGSRFPVLMHDFYFDQLLPQQVDDLYDELIIVTKELKQYGPGKVVWDFENPSKLPPWGNDISSDITDLSNYFVTSDGKDFLTVLRKALEEAKIKSSEIVIELI